MGNHIKINIAQRFKPFSHKPGATAVIPFSEWFVKAFPTRFEISDFFNDIIIVELKVSGPVKGFTLEQNLEKGICRIFGNAKEGYFEFHLFLDKEHNSLVLRYARGSEIVLFVDGKKMKLVISEMIDLVDVFYEKENFVDVEQISLGSSRKQDAELMWSRLDLKEILPIAYVAAQKVSGPSDLKIRQLPTDEESFVNFLKTGFSSILFPLRKDPTFSGVPCESLSEESTSLHRLKALQIAFRSLFLKEDSKGISFLPNLPKGFESGRFIGAKVDGAVIDFEWRKSKLRTIIIHAKEERTLRILWSKDVKSYRMGKSQKNQLKQERFKLSKGKTVLDKFHQ